MGVSVAEVDVADRRLVHQPAHQLAVPSQHGEHQRVAQWGDTGGACPGGHPYTGEGQLDADLRGGGVAHLVHRRTEGCAAVAEFLDYAVTAEPGPRACRNLQSLSIARAADTC